MMFIQHVIADDECFLNTYHPQKEMENRLVYLIANSLEKDMTGTIYHRFKSILIIYEKYMLGGPSP